MFTAKGGVVFVPVPLGSTTDSNSCMARCTYIVRVFLGRNSLSVDLAKLNFNVL